LTWGQGQTSQPTVAKSTSAAPPAPVYDGSYYRNLFENTRAQSVPVRCALVGRENTAKTGLALDLADADIQAGKKVVIFDIDNSAKATVDFVYPNADNISVLPIFDETDDSIFNEDNTTNYVALVDKVNWFVNILAEKIKENPDEYGALVFDGGSTFLKWCEHAMTYVLQNRSKNPVNPEDGDKFNQAEWRIRNQLFRDTVNRIHGLPIEKVFFTFHLKEIKEFMNDGTGKKVLMTIGERPEWEKGTMRLFSQQIFLTRYMKNPDPAAGVKPDKSLADGEWVVKAEIEEMKGKNMELLGTTHTILSVNKGKVKWTGIPALTWDEVQPEKGDADA
tara:strand:+ start:13655 stop:14656 length:1002 start_codon:yes stop_codon:yes gene_type:complete